MIINDAVDIDIRFSTHPDSQSIAIVYSVEPFPSTNVEEILGYGTFPGTVWDISNPTAPRRLNICFFETNSNLIWDPKDPAGGDFEYLLIMLSSYDEGLMYNGLEAYNLDVQYFCWLHRRPQEEWFSSEPAILKFNNTWEIYVSSKADDQEVALHWYHDDEEVESDEIDHYEIYRGMLDEPLQYISDVSVGVGEFHDLNLINYTNYTYQVIGYDDIDQPIIYSDFIGAIPFVINYNTDLFLWWDACNVWGSCWDDYTDIWGYTDDDGNEYALMGDWDGVHIIDITSDNPWIAWQSWVSGNPSGWRDIKTYQNYMYVGLEGDQGGGGIQVVDISSVQNPEIVDEWNGVDYSHNIMIDTSGFLYVIGSESGSEVDDLIILDLNEPAYPQKIGGWSGSYLHDVCVYENIVYGCGIYTNKMYALDVSDKVNPQLIHSWPGVPSAHACWVSEDGNTLFTGSETMGGHIMSWDVTDLENENVNLLDEWFPTGGENWSAHNLFVKGDYLYISYYVYGLQILDISDPLNMIKVGHYDTFSEDPNTDIYSGAWGAFPFYNSNKIVISDRATGLYVVEFENFDCDSALGDVNGDGDTSILDLVQIAYYILDLSIPDYECAADYNQDGSVDILDLVAIVNIILFDE